MFIFQLADRWGESDPRKIADLPVEILLHWRAYFIKQGVLGSDDETPPSIPETEQLPIPSPVQDECAAVMRALM